MKTSLTKLEGLKRSLVVELPVDTFNQKTERIIKSLASKVRIDGFRKGKIPASISKSSPSLIRVKANWKISSRSKVKPLIVHFSIIIWFQDQIIFKFIHLDSSSEVSRFKPRFKAQSIISFGLGNIKLIKGLIIVTVINRRQI